LDIFKEIDLYKGINLAFDINLNDIKKPDDFPKNFANYCLGLCIAPKRYFSVYQAWDKNLHCLVAIKISNSAQRVKAREIEFQNEITVLSKIKHENIIKIFDHGIFNSFAYFSMEWLDGSDLSLLVKQRGRLPFPEACEIIRQVAIGLDCIWKHQITHRDIKPSNIFLTSKGIVKILDFGSAINHFNKVLTESDQFSDFLVGTLDYIAPEQVFNSDKIDVRADIYSLGCTFFKLLTGRAPFALPEYRPLIRKLIAHTQLPFPDLELIFPECPIGISKILKKMIVKNPDDRFTTPLEIVNELSPYCQGADLKIIVSNSSSYTSLSVLDFSKTYKKSNNAFFNIKIYTWFIILLVAMILIIFTIYHFAITSIEIESKILNLNERQELYPNKHGELAFISFEKVFRGQIWKSIISKDQRHIYFGLNDGSIRKWNLLENKQVWVSGSHRIGNDEPTHSLCLSADEKFILCGGNKNWVECLDSLNGQKLWGNFNHTGKIWCSSISPDGKYGLTSGEDGMIRFYEMLTGREMQLPKNEFLPMFSGSFTNDSTVFFSSSNELKLWNINGPVLLDKAQNPQGLGFLNSFLVTQGFDNFIYSVSVSGSVFCHQVVGNSLIELYCWHNEQKEMVLSGISAHRDPITGVEKILLIQKISDNNQKISNNYSFFILTRKNELFELKEMIGHKFLVTSGQFTQDGKYAITTSLDATCRFWDVN
jgi:serine/threonine protein kinase